MQAAETHHWHRAESASLHFDAALWRACQEMQSIRRNQRMGEKQAAAANPPTIQVKPDALLWPLVRNLSVHSLELRASLCAAQGKIAQAKKLFTRAEETEKALGYHEPPIYIRPTGEAEGAAMLAAGDWAGAKAGYDQALHERPRSGFALYGLALTSEMAGDASTAAKEYAKFLAAWKNADPALPELKHARAYLAQRNPA